MGDACNPVQPGTQPEDWDGGWGRHREAQERACLAATPVQRLAWLEEAIEFARETILGSEGNAATRS